MKVKEMKVSKKWLIVAVLFLIANMIVATQYAITRIGYEYYIMHPSDANIRFLGSDNSSDGKRVLRVVGSNSTSVSVRLNLGNISTNQRTTFSAAFGIVNEELYPVNITFINVTSTNYTYMKIWLHGDRDANANSTTTDSSSVFMWNNNTIINESNTTAINNQLQRPFLPKTKQECSG